MNFYLTDDNYDNDTYDNIRNLFIFQHLSTVHRSSSNAGFGKKILRTKNTNDDVLQSKLKRGVSAYSGALNKDDVRYHWTNT